MLKKYKNMKAIINEGSINKKIFISTQLRSAEHTEEQNIINKLENHDGDKYYRLQCK